MTTFGATFGHQWVGWYLAVVHKPDHDRPWKVEYTDTGGSGSIHVASYLTEAPAQKLIELLEMLDDLDHTMHAAEVQRKALNDQLDSGAST